MGRFKIQASNLGLWLGPVAAALLIFFDLDPTNPNVSRAAAVVIWMVIWWVTEALPLAVTALLPVVLFPLMGVMSGKETSAAYFNDTVFLLIGGFIMALAMQKWDIHKRISLRILSMLGSGPKSVLLGFMLTTAVISMWVSNTATVLMVLPIALSTLLKLKDHYKNDNLTPLSSAIMLGIAYSAAIGGVATLIGTPSNLIFARVYSINFPTAPEITFVGWMKYAFPFAVLFLALTWLILSKWFLKSSQKFKNGTGIFREELNSMGRATFEQKTVMSLFFLMIIFWLTRNPIDFGEFEIPGWSALLPVAAFIDDGTVAIAVSLLLFLIPSKSVRGEKIINWETATQLDWGVVILIGGGFAMAQGMENSGLSAWLGGKLHSLQGTPDILIVLGLALLLTFMSEIASNTATAQLALPIIAALSVTIGVHPLYLMAPATLAVSNGFMLPVATPPNAIAYSTGFVKMTDMLKTGFLVNLTGVALITLATYLILNLAFGVN